MQRIIDFVSGKLTYEEFEEMFTVDSSIWSVAQALLTPEIMNDNTHPFWTKSNRYRLESNNYSIRLACLAFGFDSAAKVVTHRMLGELVSYQYPDVVLRDPPGGRKLIYVINWEWSILAEQKLMRLFRMFCAEKPKKSLLLNLLIQQSKNYGHCFT